MNHPIRSSLTRGDVSALSNADREREIAVPEADISDKERILRLITSGVLEVKGSDTGGQGALKGKKRGEHSYHDQSQDRKTLTKIVKLPFIDAPRRKKPTFIVLQEWEGYVDAIEDDSFVARMVDLTTGEEHEEEATIPFGEVSDIDVEKMDVGSIFRWVIGYERSPAGTKKRVSQIVFRDLPKITEADLERGRKWADEMAPFLAET